LQLQNMDQSKRLKNAFVIDAHFHKASLFWGR
jgi:hypothetical protein